MKLQKLSLITLLAGSLTFVSCSDDDNNSTPSGAYDNGILILNQGGFGHGDASVSFLSDNMALENNIYSGVNPGTILGDTGQDIGLKDDLAYIVLNVSNKIEIVNRYTFAHVATIDEGLDNPRYIAFYNGKAFVTNWADGTDADDDYVAVIDLANNTVTSQIAVAEGPERILEENGKLYVSHKGGYGYGNSVTVINGSSNAVATTISVGDVPNTMEVKDGKLYVMCEGRPSWSGAESAGTLSVIDVVSNAVSETLSFGAGSHPSNLDIEANKIFYTVDSGIYSMDVNADTLPSDPIFTTTEQGVYGVSCFAVRHGLIFVGDALDYNSAGKVYVYSLTGELSEANIYTVGVIPAGFYFNE